MFIMFTLSHGLEKGKMVFFHISLSTTHCCLINKTFIDFPTNVDEKMLKKRKHERKRKQISVTNPFCQTSWKVFVSFSAFIHFLSLAKIKILNFSEPRVFHQPQDVVIPFLPKLVDEKNETRENGENLMKEVDTKLAVPFQKRENFLKLKELKKPH